MKNECKEEWRMKRMNFGFRRISVRRLSGVNQFTIAKYQDKRMKIFSIWHTIYVKLCLFIVAYCFLGIYSFDFINNLPFHIHLEDSFTNLLTFFLILEIKVLWCNNIGLYKDKAYRRKENKNNRSTSRSITT